jgi:peptidylprolyl isomerase
MDAQMKQSLLIIGALLGGSALLLLALAYVFGNDVRVTTNLVDTDEIMLDEPMVAQELAPYETEITNRMNPIATINTNYGVIELELYDDAMPITAGNFMNLAREGFYDGTKFHRVIEGFMIQGGDPNTKTDEVLTYGTGGPGYTIPDEHVEGEKLSNVRGTISMANSGPESGGSQFFINLNDNTNLDFDQPPASSKHPVFGQVINGMDVVETIAQVETGQRDVPVEPVVVESVTISEG